MIGAILLTVAIVVFLVHLRLELVSGAAGPVRLGAAEPRGGDHRRPARPSLVVLAQGRGPGRPRRPARLGGQGRSEGLAGRTPPMAKVDRIAVQIKLLPLLKGDVILPLLAVDRPDVRLLREASGRANWTFGDPNAPKKPLKLPAIQHFIINDGQLRYEDQQRDIFFLGTVSSNEHATNDGRGKFVLEGKGQLNRSPFTALVTGGPLLNISPNRPYPFDAGSTRARPTSRPRATSPSRSTWAGSRPSSASPAPT
jgi:hypothetical protein